MQASTKISSRRGRSGAQVAFRLVDSLAGVVHQVEDGKGGEPLRIPARVVVALGGDRVAGVEAESDAGGAVVEGGRDEQGAIVAIAVCQEIDILMIVFLTLLLFHFAIIEIS